MTTKHRERLIATQIFQSGDPFSLYEIASKTRLDPPQAQLILDELQAEGLVVLIPAAPEDQRGPRFCKINRSSLLLRRPWNRKLFKQEAQA